MMPRSSDDKKRTSRSRKNKGMSATEKRTTKMLWIAAILVIIVAIFVMLYFPLKEYYAAHKRQQEIITELDEVAEVNEQLQEDVSRLQTEQGIEDEARREYKLVKPGENAVTVTGGSEESEEKDEEPEEEAEEEEKDSWVTSFLDFIFGFDDSQPGSQDDSNQEDATNE